eukprot:CAMPEP_0170561656 /NCGR_PEP_ID=MMETSP0211-20121228/56102_1 /TAXON_ID=311385 /ORGANISM="Pseudokeronopsis sp., Strain OXSARD2" /LENGTH=46 /DNA_ID= /DNA_START= /DNA_END= /DNA_ORIENTATION=
MTWHDIESFYYALGVMFCLIVFYLLMAFISNWRFKYYILKTKQRMI